MVQQQISESNAEPYEMDFNHPSESEESVIDHAISEAETEYAQTGFAADARSCFTLLREKYFQ